MRQYARTGFINPREPRCARIYETGSNVRALVSLALAIFLGGCAGLRAYVRPGFLDHPPKRVAVLPFVVTYNYDVKEGTAIPESHAMGRDILRKTFYYGFTPYGYEDVKLTDVDEKLANSFGPLENGAWRSRSSQELGKALGADALVYGDISRVMHFTTPLYTETSFEATFRMVDSATGEELWRKRVKAAERGGALAKKGQVVDFVTDQVRSFNPRVKFLSVAEATVRQALKGMPNPAMSIETQPAGHTGKILRLAILPFMAQRKPWQEAASTMRMLLAANLQEGLFEVIEPQRVEAALNTVGWKEGEQLPKDLSLPGLAKTLGADVFLRGTLTNWGRSYIVVESWVKAKLELELIDADSGTLIWSEKKQNTRQAGILKGPTGYSSIVTAPIMGMTRANLERVGANLASAMAKDLNSSQAVQTYMSEKTIQ